MARYHFHIYDGSGFVEDVEGREMHDLDQVMKEALKGVRSLLAEDLAEGRIDLRGRLEVVDGGGQPVLTLPFADAVHVYTD